MFNQSHVTALSISAAKQRQGLVLAVSAYVIWGLFPLYFASLRDVSPGEVLAQRIIWSLLVTLLLALFMGQHKMLCGYLKNVRVMASLAISALLIGINWLVYIWAVDQHQVVASSLGYFMSPLTSLILARLFFKETLHPLQLWAGILAILAVLWELFSLGNLPWISLVLAVAFSLYGVVRKQCQVDSVNGMTIETMWLLLPALWWLMMQEKGALAFASTPATTILLIGTGFVSALPLILFAMATRRIDLSVVGFMMYLNPSMQFLIGVFVLQESFPKARIVTFILIWLAMILFMIGLAKKQRA